MQMTWCTHTWIYIHHGFAFRRHLWLSRSLSHANPTTNSITRFSQLRQLAWRSRSPKRGVFLRCYPRGTQRTLHLRSVSQHVFRLPVGFTHLSLDKAAYPHFNIYPSWVEALVPSVQDAPPPKKAHKSYGELHDEIAAHLPAAILNNSTATGGIARRPRGLTIVAKQKEPSSPAPKVSPLRRRVVSSNQLNGRNISPSRPRVSPVFDRFPSIETRLSQSGVEPSAASVTLKRSQSLSSRPTTPKRRQSALIAERIKALNATFEPPEPTFGRLVRRATRSLPITPTRD